MNEATLAMTTLHDPGMPASATEDQMCRWLWRHFYANSWAVVPQVSVSMDDLTSAAAANRYVDGEAADRYEAGRDRRIDLLLARRSRAPEKTGALETMAIEVKVSRSDFRSDILNPEKQAPWRTAATRHAYAVPAGLVQPDEIPAASGLIWVTPPTHGDGLATIEWKKRAPFPPGHRPKLPMRVFMTMLYRTSRFEGDVRAWNYRPEAAGTVEDVRAALHAAHKTADRAEKRAEKSEDAAERWKRAYALATPDGLPCAICGEGVKPHYPKGEWFRGWKHVTKGQDEECVWLEVTQREDASRELWEAADDAKREEYLRHAHRFRLDEKVNAEPWRAPMRSEYELIAARKPHPADPFPEEPTA